VDGLVPLALSLMCDVDEEDDEWATGDYSVDTPDDSSAVGEEAVERAASGMGGRMLAPPVIAIVERYSGSEDSKCRRAAVAALSRLAEGCTALFKKDYLQLTLAFFTRTLVDPSQRVQYQTIQAIGRLADLFPETVPDMVELYFVPLVELLGAEGTCDRVRGHVASAFINMIRPADEDGVGLCDEGTRPTKMELTAENLERLLSTLCSTLQMASIQVQPVCLTLLG
jgi:HEAT repeat protein